jgi:RHS repeat-associated protein/prepilin-type N-terminal cleavage/methylation domain-containing protein
LLYTGEQFDTGLQQYYLRARYYNQCTGRFGQLDPFRGLNFDPQSLHKYAYAHDDPVNNIDPSGQFTLVELVIVIAIIGILAGLLGGAISAATGGSFAEGFARGIISGTLTGLLALWLPLPAAMAIAAGIAELVIQWYVYDWSDCSASRFLLRFGGVDFHFVGWRGCGFPSRIL